MLSGNLCRCYIIPVACAPNSILNQKPEKHSDNFPYEKQYFKCQKLKAAHKEAFDLWLAKRASGGGATYSARGVARGFTTIGKSAPSAAAPAAARGKAEKEEKKESPAARKGRKHASDVR